MSLATYSPIQGIPVQALVEEALQEDGGGVTPASVVAAVQAMTQEQLAAIQSPVSGGAPPQIGKPGNLRLVIMGYDSLTAGAASSSFRTYFDAVARSHAGYGGPGLMMLKNRSGFGKTSGVSYLTLPASGDGIYSLNGEGLTVSGGAGADYFTQSSLGGDWTTCTVFYRQKTGGGAFRLRTADMSGGTGLLVNTAGAAGLGSAVLNAGGKTTLGRTVVCGEITGNVTIYALLFVQSAVGYLPGNIAIGGTLLQDHAALDATARAAWIAALQPSHWIVNGGMNDRATVSAATHGANLSSIVSAIRSGAPDCQITIVQSNDPSDAATSFFGSYAEQKMSVARAAGAGYWDERTLLGGYANAVAKGWMADAVHPNDAANRIRARGLLAAIGLPSAGADPGMPSPVAVQQYFGALTQKQFAQAAANSPTLLYSLGMTNGYPGAYIEVSVTCQRFGAGAAQRKTVRAFLNGGTTSGNVNAVNTPTVSTDYTAGAPGTLNLTVEIESGKCNIYANLVEYAGYGSASGRWEAGYAGNGGNIVVEY